MNINSYKNTQNSLSKTSSYGGNSLSRASSNPSYSSISDSFNRMGLGGIDTGDTMKDLEKASMRLGEAAAQREGRLAFQKGVMSDLFERQREKRERRASGGPGTLVRG